MYNDAILIPSCRINDEVEEREFINFFFVFSYLRENKR